MQNLNSTKRILICFTLATIFTNCISKPKFKILPLNVNDTQTQIINGRPLTMRDDYFLIDNTSFNDHGIQDFIADFVSKSDSLKGKYDYYEMKFYRKTKSVNDRELQKFSQKWKFFQHEKPLADYDYQFGKLIN